MHKIFGDNHLEIKFNDKNQVYYKIAWGQGGYFLPFHSSFVCKYTSLLLWRQPAHEWFVLDKQVNKAKFVNQCLTKAVQIMVTINQQRNI